LELLILFLLSLYLQILLRSFLMLYIVHSQQHLIESLLPLHLLLVNLASLSLQLLWAYRTLDDTLELILDLL